MATTTLTITPKFEKKTAKFEGTVAAGEQVSVTVADPDGYIASATNLRLRAVGPRGETMAQFPLEDDDVWGAGTGTHTCTFNLNTTQMLLFVPPAATMRVLFVLDDATDGTLYFKDFCAVEHWPRRVGEDEPVDLAGYADKIAELEDRVADAEGEAALAKAQANSAANTAGNALTAATAATAKAQQATQAVTSLGATKADKVDNATAGNFAGLDAYGNLTDSGVEAGAIAAAQQTADDAADAAAAAQRAAEAAQQTANGNADDISGINAKIPAQASANNQLADKDFVNSSVATNTANYIYKTDAQGNHIPFSSLSELQAYSGTLTNNDYAFVVGQDSAGNTTYTRYKWSEATETWAEEYVLNNSSFTAAQWAAINSAITSGLVAKLTDLPTATELAQQLAALAEKRDKTDLAVYQRVFSFVNTDGVTVAKVYFAPKAGSLPERVIVYDSDGTTALTDVTMTQIRAGATGWTEGPVAPVSGWLYEISWNGAVVGWCSIDARSNQETFQVYQSDGTGTIGFDGYVASVGQTEYVITRYTGTITDLGVIAGSDTLAKTSQIPAAVTVASTLTQSGTNPVKSSGIWSALWGALTALPTGFASLYDWCVSQLSGKVSKSGDTMTGLLSVFTNGPDGDVRIRAGYDNEFYVGLCGDGLIRMAGGREYYLGIPEKSGILALLSDTMRFTTTSSYAVGDVVFYSGAFYRCTTAHTSAAWNASHFSEVIGGLSTGTPTAPTPASGDDSTKVATTAFVQAAVTVDSTLTQNGTNPVKSSGIWSALWGSVTSTFTSITAWVQNLLTGYLQLTGGTMTGVLYANDSILATDIYAQTDGTAEHLGIIGGDSATFADIITTALGSSTAYAKPANIPSASSATPQMDGTASTGSSAEYARGDHIHPSDTTRLAATSGAPAYDATATYAVGATVSYNGGLYRCTNATVAGTLPTDSSYWTPDVLANRGYLTTDGNGNVFAVIP